MLIRTLSALECTKLLTANRVGRLACAKDGQPYVVPFHYAHADNHLYAFSMPGKKIEWMRGNPLVSVQVDERGEGRGWQSAVVDGLYEELPDRIGHKIERDHAWELLSKHSDWWEPGALKPVMPPVSDSTPPCSSGYLSSRCPEGRQGNRLFPFAASPAVPEMAMTAYPSIISS